MTDLGVAKPSLRPLGEVRPPPKRKIGVIETTSKGQATPVWYGVVLATLIGQRKKNYKKKKII
jgi:hypothetical protein